MTNFETARRFAGISGVELAARLEVSPQQVNNWARGLRTPGRSTVDTIAAALDVDAAWLLGVAQILPVIDPLQGEVYSCPIIRTEALPGYGALYIVWLEPLQDWMPVVQGAGLQFTLADWQSAYRPKRADEIGEYHWMDARGTDAVMLDGLPRALA